MNATFLGVGQNILLTPPTYFKVVTTPPHPTPQDLRPCLLFSASGKPLLSNASAAGIILICLFTSLDVPLSTYFAHSLCTIRLRVTKLAHTVEGLHKRTEHLDIFLPVTPWCSISDVLITGGRGVSDFSVLKYY